MTPMLTETMTWNLEIMNIDTHQRIFDLINRILLGVTGESYLLCLDGRQISVISFSFLTKKSIIVDTTSEVEQALEWLNDPMEQGFHIWQAVQEGAHKTSAKMQQIEASIEELAEILEKV